MGLDNLYGLGSLRPGVCTSTSRPSAPFDGQLIYETDTDRIAVWDNGSWVYKTPASTLITAIDSATVATSQTTSSTSYTDLATAGPSVTLTTGTKCLVIMTANMTVPAAGGFVSFAVSGATTTSASDARSLSHTPDSAAGQRIQASAIYYETVTSGSNTFTMKYRSGSANNTTYVDRTITVVAL